LQMQDYQKMSFSQMHLIMQNHYQKLAPPLKLIINHYIVKDLRLR
jgi:hypothetical protein